MPGIQLLAAIPARWGVAGSFKGLKARECFTVDCSWRNGRVVAYKITSRQHQKVKLRVNGELKEIVSSKEKIN